MTWPGSARAALAPRYDAWFDSPWGCYAWRVLTVITGTKGRAHN
jgi:hypothetical protein